MVTETTLAIYVIGLAISVFICGMIYAVNEFVHNRKPDLWDALEFELASRPYGLACLFWPVTVALAVVAIVVVLLIGMGIGLVKLLVWATKAGGRNEH